MDYEHQGGYRWFLRVRAYQFRGPFWWGWVGTAGQPSVHYPLLNSKVGIFRGALRPL